MDELQAYLQQEAEKDRRAAGLEASLRRGMTRNPDEYAKALTLAAKTGKAPALVGEFLPEVEQEDRLHSLDVTGLIQSHPRAAAWLSDENNASIAHDDVENLTSIEAAHRRAVDAEKTRVDAANAGKSWYSGLGATFLRSINELFSMPDDVSRAAAGTVLNWMGAKLPQPASLEGPLSVNPISNFGAIGRANVAFLKGFERETPGLFIRDPKSGKEFMNLKAWNPFSTGGLENVAKLMTGEAPSTVAMVGLTAATGGGAAPALGAKGGKVLGLIKSAARYAMKPGAAVEVGRTIQAQHQQGIEELMAKRGMSREEAESASAPGALLAGVFSAALGAPMEAKILEDLLEKTARLPGGQSLVKRIGSRLTSAVTTAGKEGTQEVLNGVGEDLAAWMTWQPDKTIADFGKSALQNFIGGAVMGGTLGATFHGVRPDDHKFVQALGDAARDSKLRQRSPEAFGQAVQTMVEGTDHESVMIPAERFQTFFQEKGADPAQVAEQLGARNYLEALAAGTDVVIPTASYARDIAGTDLHAELAPDIRFRPWDMSPRELEAYQAQAAQVEPEVQQQAQEAAAAAPAWWAIQEKTQAQLEAAGFEPKTAEAYATLHAKAMASLAERAGLDPMALDARYGLEVSRPAPGETPSMSLADTVLERLKTTQPGEDITQPVQPLRLDELGFWQGPVDQPAPKGVHFDNLTPEAQQRVVKGIESDIQTWVDDPQGFVNAYAAFPQSMGGRLVNGDIINAMMPAVAENVPLGLAAMKQVDAALQSQVITLHKHLRQHAYDLAGDLPVGITAGAQASGKTRTAEWLLGDGIMGAVIDAPHDDAKTVNHYIQEALGRGKDAAVVFVDRPDFGASFKSMLRRSTREGRMVPPGGMMDTRLKVPGEMLKVAQEHRNSHRVSLYHLKAAENGQPSIVGGSLAEDGKDAAISIRERAAEDRSALETQAREAYLSYLKGPNEPELPADIRRDLEAAFPGGVGENAGGAGVVGADAGAGGSAAPDLQPELQAGAEGLGPIQQALQALGIDPAQVASGADLLAAVRQVAAARPELAEVARDLERMLAGGDVLFQSAQGGSPRLSALHNLSIENLVYADKMGGLAVPSMAVVKGDMGMRGFGGITLIGGKDLVDPSSNPVFNADAYAPRFPRAEYGKAKSSVVQKFYDKLKPLAKEFDDQRALTILWDYSVNTPDPEQVIREFTGSNMAKAAFLREQGENVEPVVKPATVEAVFIGTPAWDAFQAETGWDRNYDVNDAEYVGKLSKAISEGINQWASKQAIPEEDAKYLVDANKRGWLGDDGQFKLNKEHALTRSLAAVGRMDVDTYATRDALDEKLKGRESEFKAWVDEKVLGLFGEPFLKLGRTKVPYTLPNIVEAMTGAVKNQEKGMTFGDGAARAAMSRQFKDLEEMRAEAGTSMASEAEVEQALETSKKLTEQYRMAVVEQFKGLNWKGEVDTWEALDASMRALAKMAKKKRPTDADIRAALRSENFNVTNLTEQAIDLAKQTVEAFRTAPVPYFEAKPQRAVRLSEFAGAVIPETAPQQVRDILDKHGIKWSTYSGEENQEAATVEMRQELAGDGANVLFQSYKDDMSFGSKAWQEYYLGRNKDGGRRLGDRARRARAAMKKAQGQMAEKAELDRRAEELRVAEEEFRQWEEGVKALQAGEVFPTYNRGFIRFGPDRTFHIGLLQDADLSTFVHETGHFYLEVLGDLAEMEGVSPQVKEDHAALLKWLGVDSREQIGREQHEKFARANEAYLMEGKAPSAHLQGVFARVSNWLKLIYRSVSRLVKLNDEVRAVFDRLYASDEEIEAAKKDMGEAPLFATAEDAGMTEAEFALYSKAVAAETDTAKAALASRLNRELLRERASWWKEGLERETEAAAAEVDADPAQRAFVALTKGELQDGTPIKLSKEAIEAQFGEGFAKNLPRSFRRLYAREGGMDAEAAAEFLGFDSGEQLIEALRTLEPRKDRIKALAEARMKERHGDMLVDGSIQDAAMEALHNQHREEVLMQELRAIRRLQAQVKPFVEQQAKEQREAERQDRRDARAATVVPPMETFRKAARELVEQQAVKDLQPYRYLVAERQLSRAAMEAMAKKDYQAAGDARQKALLNHHLYLEAVKAKEEVEAIYDFGAKALKPRIQAMLGKAGAGFQEQHNAILERYEFVRVTNRELAERAASLAVWAQAQAANGEEISIDPVLYREQPKNFRECTVPELRAVRDALKNIQTVARRQVELEVEGRKVDKEEAIEAMRSSAYEHAKKVRPLPVDPLLKTAGDKARGLLLGGDAMLLKLEQVIDWLDGGDINGPWREHIFQPIAEAQVREYAMHQAITGKLVEAMEAMPKEQRLSMLDAYDIPGIGKVSRKMILSMALNMGNAENFEKMLKGHGWASPEGMEAVTRATGKLNRADWEFVQKTWDIINSLWPAIAELEHRMTGLEPVKVEAKPFTVTLEDGTTMALQGGYYPLAYDPERSSQGASQAGGDLSQLFEKGYVKATTSKGHTQARVNFAAPLVLDFEQVLTGHVTKVVKDLTHREAVVAVNKLITDQRVRSAIQETLGPEYEAQFLPWLRSVVNDRNGSAAQGLGGFSRFMMKMRSNMVVATIGFKISSVIVQATDLVRASDRVKKTELGKALLDFMRHPVEVTQQVREMSGEMRFRSENLDRDIRAALQRLTGKNSAWAEVQRFAFHGIGLADTITSVPTWLGAYRQALKEGAPEEQAIREADRTARLVLQVGSPKDLTPIQRQNELAKFVTMFMGDATATYGILRDAGHQVRGVKDVPKWAARVLFAVMIPAILGDLIKGQGPGDDEDKGAWAARKALLSAPNTIPVLRDMTKILDNGWSYRFSPAVSGLEKAGHLFLQTGTALDKGDWDRVVFTGADMFGTLAGVPGTAQIITSGRYLYKVHSGDERPENSMDIAKGVALGAKQKGRK